MSGRAAKPAKRRAAARVARPPTPEEALAARDAEMLLREAFTAFHAGLAASAAEPSREGAEAETCDWAALAPGDGGHGGEAGALDRLVIQNWNGEAGFVSIGEVQLELEPGQAVTLWVNRDDPTPPAALGEERPARSTYTMLADEEVLVV